MHPRLEPYHPPSWAKTLNHVPKVRATLAMTNTPIHDWKLPGTPDEFKVYIKREDMTGSVLGGSKVRKLEFILGEAKVQSIKHIITTGRLGSNHCRATAAACVELGLTPHLFTFGSENDVSTLKFDGNMLINKLVGAHLHLVDDSCDYDGSVLSLMKEFAAKIEEDSGEKALVVPVGGSNVTGIWGYLQCFEEIRQEGIEFDDLICVGGSGGLVGGLAIGNYLNGSPYKVHGVVVGHEVKNKLGRVDVMMKELGMTGVEAREIITLHEDYAGLGYSRSQPFELDFIARTAAETGIILDPTYTGKAAYGLSQLMQNRPEVFKERRVLFIHSGGLQDIHSSIVMDKLLPYSTASEISVCAPP